MYKLYLRHSNGVNVVYAGECELPLTLMYAGQGYCKAFDWLGYEVLLPAETFSPMKMIVSKRMYLPGELRDYDWDLRVWK